MLAGQANSYDEIPYADNCFHYTHPDHLAAIGTVFGMNVPPPSDRCRVLELGCARGGNIIPTAQALPEARFVGIDLSSRQIAEGRAVAERLGLQNFDLRAIRRHLALMGLDWDVPSRSDTDQPVGRRSRE